MEGHVAPGPCINGPAMRLPVWISILMLVLAGACGDDGGGATDAPVVGTVDEDGDGVASAPGNPLGDCDDTNANVYPGAPEACDFEDNDCDGTSDEGFDEDGDNISICMGDCADNDPEVRPGAAEPKDGLDNDCDGLVDNHTEMSDDDQDGWAEDQGDCNDEEPFINPGAFEVPTKEDGTPEGIDNDCDGVIDEAVAPCSEDSLVQDDPFSYAAAIGLCEGVRVARFEAPTDVRQREIRTRYGTTYVPRAGTAMIGLSSGVVADEADPDFVLLDSGTEYDTSHGHPAPSTTIGCGGEPDPTTVYDYAALELELEVPTNAQSFSFDFNFMSVEYPEYVCDIYDDTFVAYLDSDAFTGNVSFDSMGNPVSINAAFFTVCSGGGSCTGDAELDGTGYQDGNGGGTGWLTTTAPVRPGEKVTLRFIIFDEGDWILDSAVLIDNFRWHLEAVDMPMTEG
jgi:hypothetical protein